MTFKPQVANPLALAVLGTLGIAPMHPYEIATTMRDHGLEYSIKLNFGSLYTVVDALQRKGLIEVKETIREGRRPERTVYAISEAGRVELEEWIRALVREPIKEYTQFAAGLCFLGRLPPGEAVELLERRAARLAEQIAEARGRYEPELEKGMNPIFFIEYEHAIALLQAELDWVRGLVRRIHSNEMLFWDTRDGQRVLVNHDGDVFPAARTVEWAGPPSDATEGRT